MSSAHEAEHSIRITLHRYCQSFDAGDFTTFAELFQHGQWFMVDKPGAAAVLAWIQDNIILYDGRPLTRHLITNLIVQVDDLSDKANFSCYIDISQHLPDREPIILAQARFEGVFASYAAGWVWKRHSMQPDYAGDLSTHIKQATTAVS